LDFNFPYTLLQSSIFNCDKHSSCQWKDKQLKTAKYGSYEYVYKEALITMKFQKILPSHSKSKDKYEDVQLLCRITNSYNVLGVNDLTTMNRYIPPGNEFVIDLKAKTIKIQEIPKSKSNIFYKFKNH
jgi:hypothetical protein